MKLPGTDEAIIEQAKMLYLLNPAHPDNGGKARLFVAIGYRLEEWQRLQADFRSQHLPLDATELEAHEYGRKFEIVGPLVGPVGAATIVSGWIVRWGEDFPRFVTAYQE